MISNVPSLEQSGAKEFGTSPLCFAAAASVVTNAAQNVPPAGLVTSTSVLFGQMQPAAGELNQLIARFKGDDTNSSQTVTFQIFAQIAEAAPVAVAGLITAAMATTSGYHTSALVKLAAPYKYPAGTVFTCVMVPSTTLGAVLTLVNVAAT